MVMISDISDGELPRALSGLGQTTSNGVFATGGGPLSKGTQGESVRRMQALLNSFGYKLTPDGIFGSGTEAAVRAVQAKLGMAQTGIYDNALDARITSMNQSGIIDATPNDLKQIAVARSMPASNAVPGLIVSTGQPKPGDQLVIPNEVMTPGLSVMDRLHNLVRPVANILRVDPMMVVVGGGLLLGSALLYGVYVATQGRPTKLASPASTVKLNGVGKKRRKSRRKTKRSSK